MGRFGNDILLRTSLSANPTFRELLVRVRDTALTAYSDQNLPFGALLEHHSKGTDPGRALPFQVMFILQNAPKEHQQVPGLCMTWISLYTGTAKYDLNVWLKTEPTLDVILEYRTDLFRASTIKKILEDYHVILENAVNDPGARIHKLIARESEPPQVSSLAPAPAVLESKNGAAPPKDDLQSRLVEVWEEIFDLRPIGVDHDFFELGGDSLMGARLFARIEESFKTNLPLAALLEAPTIRQLAAIINGRKKLSSGSSTTESNGQENTKCLVTVQRYGTKPPLFCVHTHTGNIFYAQKLSRALGVDQPVFGLVAKGLTGEEPHTKVEDMATHYLREIRTIQPHGPYWLCGFCFGGTVAYEMARVLKTQGEEVALLVLLNTASPGSLKGWPFSCLTKRFIHELKKIHALRGKEKLVVLGRKVSGLTKLIFGSFERLLWRVLPRPSSAGAGKGARQSRSVANLSVFALKAYNPAPYAGRIVLFVTEEVASRYTIDPARGWGDLAADGIEVYRVEGDNLTLFDGSNIHGLAEKLRVCIARVASSDKTPRLLVSTGTLAS